MSLIEAIEILKEKGVTAYEIASKTDLTEAGVLKILSGKTKKPHKSTIQTLINYAKSIVNNGNELISDNDFSVERVALYVAMNEDEFMKEKVFSNIIEKRVAIRLMELTSDPVKFKRFLEQ